MELFVIRHGTTDWNSEGKFQGCQNIPLNQNGRELAAKLRNHLADVNFDYIYSSPLDRALETARILRSFRKIPIITDKRLIEISFGEGEGIPFGEWMKTKHARKYFFSEPEKYEPPKNGETFLSAMERSKNFVQTVIEPIYNENPNAKIMLVAHGAINSALTCYLEKRTVKNFWGKGLKGNCQETIYTYNGKKWQITEDTEPQENNYIKQITKTSENTQNNAANTSDKTAKILKKSDKTSIQETTLVLKKGGITIIPTDTVYGFSGITTLPTDEQIRAIKGRAETKPLIQLIAAPQYIFLYTNDTIPQELLSKWPGALTIIVNLKPEHPLATKLPTVAFRCPGDKWLRDIISQLECPIYSTSVNRSGQPVIDTIDGIKTEFSNEVDLIIDDGDKKGALPSTLVKIDDGKIVVLRQGSVQI